MGQSAFFGARGYEVVTVDHAQGAIERILEAHPDVIVLDLMMEHYDSGFLLSRRIRQEASLTAVPIIMLSGVAGATGHKLAGDMAALKEWVKLDVFLDKPVTGAQLLKVVEERLGARAATAAEARSA
jgi:CheY-like chemotaxis protein